MDRRIVLGSIAAVALGGVGGWLLLRGGDEQQIRDAIARLAKAVRIAKDDSPVGRAARIQSALDDLVVTEVAVDIPELPDARPGRAELLRLAAAAQGIWSSLEVELANVRVTIDPGASSASVDATATLHGARAGAEEKSDARRVAFRLVKDGGWKVSAITVHPPSE